MGPLHFHAADGPPTRTYRQRWVASSGIRAERLGPRGAGEHGRQGDKETGRQGDKETRRGGTHPSMKGEGDGTAAGSTERLAPSAEMKGKLGAGSRKADAREQRGQGARESERRGRGRGPKGSRGSRTAGEEAEEQRDAETLRGGVYLDTPETAGSPFTTVKAGHARGRGGPPGHRCGNQTTQSAWHRFSRRSPRRNPRQAAGNRFSGCRR
jgi:hypothetical protein